MHHDLVELQLRQPLPDSALAPASGPDGCALHCPEFARRTQQLEQQRVEDLAAVVAALHETIAALGAEVAAWQGDLHASVGRFDAIASQPDPATLRSLLFDEVRTLKKAVVDRRQKWDATRRAYAERVTTLEVQLRTTRAEASTDGLTGLANRRAFDREIALRLRSSHQRMVLALFDVDDFKGVNDSRGHQEGDRVLVGIAKLLEQSVRPGDMVARLGGDEFALLIAGLPLRQAQCRMETLVSEVGVAIHGVSCGLAEFSAGDTAKTLYDRADGALYDAKHDGKQRVGVRVMPYVRDLKAGLRN